MSRTSVVMDDCLKSNVKALARRQNVTMGSVVRSALIDYLVKNQMKPFEIPSVDVNVKYEQVEGSVLKSL